MERVLEGILQHPTIVVTGLPTRNRHSCSVSDLHCLTMSLSFIVSEILCDLRNVRHSSSKWAGPN